MQEKKHGKTFFDFELDIEPWPWTEQEHWSNKSHCIEEDSKDIPVMYTL